MHTGALKAALGVLLLAVQSIIAKDTPAFTYNEKQFLLHGKPFFMVGGQMDPQRIPHEYWRDRLVKAKAMGLNTVFIYTFWNMLEPEQGQWASDLPENDIAKFATIAQEEGIYIVLRPGPYVCGEREWGGYPYWLSQVPGIVVRDNNTPFLAASRNYVSRLAEDLKELQITNGGPILMVQVENEYGSFGEDMDYKIAMRDMVKASFDIPLYTTDGGGKDYLEGGYIPGVLAEPDGGAASAFKARDDTIKDKSSLGPLVLGEFYVVRSDSWGPKAAHNTDVGHPGLTQSYLDDISYILSANNSFSFYMWHGGTNFGFSTGALWQNRTVPWTTSYDHGSPLDESGRTNALYFKMRDEISKYVPLDSIPEPPKNIPLLSIQELSLPARYLMFDGAKESRVTDSPVTMDAMGQAYGFVLYEHNITEPASGVLQVGDRARDRIIVVVNGSRRGIIDSFNVTPAKVTLDLHPGDQLQLLVENMGRVNYWNRWSGTPNMLRDPIKGIKGDVTVGGSKLIGWASRSLAYDEAPKPGCNRLKNITAGSPPVIYSGKVWVGGSAKDDPATRDTYLAVPRGIRGFVWVNGFNLGRFWVAGPQQSLYLPGTILQAGSNTITVLELEPTSNELAVRGDATRLWKNNPDPDAP